MLDIEKAKQVANEIEARHRDITKLETSIKELHAMFADLALLVTTQVYIILLQNIFMKNFHLIIQG